MILYYRVFPIKLVILPLSADMATSADMAASAEAASADMDRKNPPPVEDLVYRYQEVMIDGRSPRTFLRKIHKFIEINGLAKFVELYGRGLYGKEFLEIAKGINNGYYIPVKIPWAFDEDDVKSTFEPGVFEEVFRPESREVIRLSISSNKHMGVLPNFVKDCKEKNIDVSTAMFASLYWFLKMQYGSDAAHEAFTVCWDNVGNGKKSPIEDLTQDCPIALLLSGNFPYTPDKMDCLFEAVFKQLNSRITPQVCYHQEKDDLLKYFWKYYNARKDTFWTEETGFNESFLNLLEALRFFLKVFAHNFESDDFLGIPEKPKNPACLPNYEENLRIFWENGVANDKYKFVATNDKLCRQMDDLRSRIIYLFEDKSSRGTVKQNVPPKYPSCMAD